MKVAWGVPRKKEKPDGRPSNQYVWDQKCVRLLLQLAASGVTVEDMPSKPVMPKCRSRDSPGPCVEISASAGLTTTMAAQLNAPTTSDNTDGLEVELQVAPKSNKKRKLHRSEDAKLLFFTLHEKLHHKSMTEVRSSMKVMPHKSPISWNRLVVGYRIICQRHSEISRCRRFRTGGKRGMILLLSEVDDGQILEVRLCDN